MPIFKINYFGGNKTYNRFPKKVYSYWDKDKYPERIQRIINHNKNYMKKSSDWEWIFIHDSTLNQFIPQQDIPPHFNNFTPQFKSDYIRLYLLANYGGVWMDISSILLQDLSWLDRINKDMAYYTPNYGINLYESSKHQLGNSKGDNYIENWFLAFNKESYIIQKWYEIYKDIAFKIRSQNELINTDICRKYPLICNLFSTYLFMHCIYNYLLDIDPKFKLEHETNLIKYNSREGPLFNEPKYQEWIRIKKENGWFIPFIKLIRSGNDADYGIESYQTLLSEFE